MIDCPHCDRAFEKRAGLMRHISSIHAEEATAEPPTGDVTWTEPDYTTLTPITTGDVSWEQTPYDQLTPITTIDVEHPDGTVERDVPIADTPLGQPFDFYVDDGIHLDAGLVETPVRLTMEPNDLLPSEPSDPILARDEHVRIRNLVRGGVQEDEAWMAVTGHHAPPRAIEEDTSPLHLSQVRFRVRSDYQTTADARWLLELVDAAEVIFATIDHGIDAADLITLWKERLQ